MYGGKAKDACEAAKVSEGVNRSVGGAAGVLGRNKRVCVRGVKACGNGQCVYGVRRQSV